MEAVLGSLVLMYGLGQLRGIRSYKDIIQSRFHAKVKITVDVSKVSLVTYWLFII